MSIVAGYNRVFAVYASDDGNFYMVGTTADNATAGGLNTTTPGSGVASLPRGYVMRHVYGVASDGSRTKVPVGTSAASLWTAGGTFTKYGKSYTSEGKIGEKRTNRGG